MRAHLALALLGLLTSACATPPPPEPQIPELSTAMSADATPWSVDEFDRAIHGPTGGVCPTSIGSFLREEYSVLGMQDRIGNPRYDGICQYKNDNIGSFITAYFSPAQGASMRDEMLAILSSIRSRNDVTFLAEESASCTDALKATETETGGASASCAALDFSGLSGRTYATLDEHNGWFFKLRATARIPDAENYRLVEAAILDFHAQQP